MKELSATILVRPFGLTTLSTYVYDFASIARFDEAAPACLVIVMISLIPTLLLARTDPGAEVNARAR